MIDSIADFEKIGGLEELLRCLLLIPSLDYHKLLDALELYGRAQLYQKAGFFLRLRQSSFRGSGQFYPYYRRCNLCDLHMCYPSVEGIRVLIRNVVIAEVLREHIFDRCTVVVTVNDDKSRK